MTYEIKFWLRRFVEEMQVKPQDLVLPGVLSQATKNKTYTPKNICSNASKDFSHGEYLA